MNTLDFLDYLEGKLTPEQRAETEQALREQPELKSEFDEAQRIHAGFDAVRARELTPPAEMLLKAEALLRHSLKSQSVDAHRPDTLPTVDHQHDSFGGLLNRLLEFWCENVWLRPFAIGAAALLIVCAFFFTGGSRRVVIEVADVSAAANNAALVARTLGGHAERDESSGKDRKLLVVIPETRLAEFRDTLQGRSSIAQLRLPPPPSPDERMVQVEVVIRSK